MTGAVTDRWRPAPRTKEAAAVHADAEADRAARPERYRLDPDVIASVAAKGGDDADFAPGWRAGVEQYLGSARDDGRLNALGTAMVASTAVGRLRAGAAMTRFLRSYERSSTNEPIAPPIVITGGWRTGTTYLFRMMATDPRLRAPLPAELSSPTRVATMSAAEREAFVDAAAGAHDALHVLSPELRVIHDSGPRLAEECVLAMGTDLRNWGFTSTTRLDSYAEWLAGEDMAGSYERYRHVIELLGRGDGRRWVLKAPAHLAELDHLVAAFPGCVVVHLHRDIVETIASGASLFATFRSMYSDEVDAVDVGRFQAEQTERWMRRAVAFRSSPASVAATFVDLDYRRFVDDPVTALGIVYAAAGLEPPPDPAGFVASYQASQPRHAHGAHRYTAGDFGLDEHELRERFSFLDR